MTAPAHKQTDPDKAPGQVRTLREYLDYCRSRDDRETYLMDARIRMEMEREFKPGECVTVLRGSRAAYRAGYNAALAQMRVMLSALGA